MRLAFLLSGNDEDAHDITQEALTRAFANWDRVSAADDLAVIRRGG